MPSDTTRSASANYEDYFELQRALRALGDEVRLNIVRVLAGQGEVNVTDLAATLLISQPLVSWHVGSLRRAGLAHKRRQGREVYISLDMSRYHAVLRQLGALVTGEAGAAAPDARVAPTNPAESLRGR
jgi:DNA-binding transcriptional ArsR family regulator